MLKKLFSHTAIYGIAPQVPKLASILALPLITGNLTELDFGVYGVVLSISAALAALSTLGLRLVLVNSFYKSPNYHKWAWRQIYGFLILWNIPFAAIMGIVLLLFIPAEAENNRLLIIVLNVLPTVLFGPTSIIATTYYQLAQKPIKIAWRSIVFGLVSVILTVLFIRYWGLGYIGWFLATAISTILTQLSYWLALNTKLGLRPIFNFKRRFLRNSLKVSIPTVPYYYSAYLLDSSDRALMKMLGTPTSHIGLYSVAYMVGDLMRSVGGAVGLAVSPMMNESYKKGDDERARDLIFVLQICFLSGTFLASVWMKELFTLFIRNTELQKVYPLGIIIMMAYNYRPMYYGSNNKLFYEEKTLSLLKVTFIAGVINVAANLLLIPVYGYKAAAYTTYFSLMYMGYAGFYFRAFKQINNAKFYPLFWLLLTFLLTAIASLVVETRVVVKFFVSIVFFAATAGAFFKLISLKHNNESSEIS